MRRDLCLPLAFAWAVLLAGCGGTEPEPIHEPLGRAGQAPDPGAFRGELVDLGCYLRQGARGEAHRACAVACLRNGAPAGLLTESGEVLLLLQDPKLTERIDFAALAARRCEVQGALLRRGGLRGILVRAIEQEAPVSEKPR